MRTACKISLHSHSALQHIHCPSHTLNIYKCAHFLKIFLFYFIFLERGEGREKERERNIDVREKHLLCIPTRDWTCNLVTCPDPESNQRPFALWTMPNQLSHTGQGNNAVFFLKRVQAHLSFWGRFFTPVSASESPGRFTKIQVAGLRPTVSDSICLVGSLRKCISNKFLGDAEAVAT